MVPLFHRDLGGTGRPPLILLHGLLGSSRNWQSVGAELADRYHVFAIDLRNHGRSPHDPVMTYSAMLDDVTNWMGKQSIPRASLLGHSMGGKVAMLLACRQPQRVERLIVVDIAPNTYLSAAHRAEFGAMNELNLAMLRSRAEAEMRFEARVPDWAMRKFLATNLEREEGGAGEWRWIVNLPVLTSSLGELEKTPLLQEDVFTGPTLFITGGKSRYVQLDDRKAIETHFPGARVETIPGSGHNPHMEARPEFVAAVLRGV